MPSGSGLFRLGLGPWRGEKKILDLLLLRLWLWSRSPGMESFSDITALTSMIEESRNAVESMQGQGETQPPMAISSSKVVVKELNASKQTVGVTKSIWNIDEIPTEDAVVNYRDDRPCPRYEFSYKQVVGTQDTFLGLGDKTPSSADCSHLIIKVHFPGCKMRDVDLDVTKERIKVESKALRLFTYLPVAVDKDNGNAKFDTSKEVLTVTLPILREV